MAGKYKQLAMGGQQTVHAIRMPRSPHISPHLPTSPHISRQLHAIRMPRSALMSLHLPILSFHISRQVHAIAMLHEAAKAGHWLCLKNLHLVVHWVPQLEKALAG